LAHLFRYLVELLARLEAQEATLVAKLDVIRAQIAELEA
jgi:hypothetical protein